MGALLARQCEVWCAGRAALDTARLRNRRFFSLAELNQSIRELVDQLNVRPMRGWGTTRRALYEQLDRPALRGAAADTL